MDFVIDTVGDFKNNGKQEKSSIIADLLEDYKDFLPSNNRSEPKTKKLKEDDIVTKKILKDLKTPIESKQNRKSKNIKEPVPTLSKNKEVQKALEKSIVLKPEFEQLHSVSQFSDKKLKELRKEERKKSKGKKWYGLPATEMTEEVKRDLEIIQMRSVLDPKHFYKKNDLNVLPKYFQVGKVLDSPLDYYNNRLTKKERKKTLVDELLADAEFSKYNKRKYKEIIEEKQKTHYKEWRKAKRLKKRK